MIINGIEAKQYDLSYDKIVKNTLASSDEMTIRFINGLFGDNISLDAPVVWLDKESIDDRYSAIVADFYPKVDGRMYAIEIEQDDSGDMAIRVFKYSVGGAILHNLQSSKSELNITFPQPCVIFLSGSKKKQIDIRWNINFFDGQRVKLQIPAIQLGNLSIKEIAERDLLPIGQFYLRTFEPLTQSKARDFQEAAKSLFAEVKNAVDCGIISHDVGFQMQNTIQMTINNVLIKSKQEVAVEMTTNIKETLPWIDFADLHKKLEERGRSKEREKINEELREIEMQHAAALAEKDASLVKKEAEIAELRAKLENIE